MIVHEGLIGAFNYTIGPALIYESPSSLDALRIQMRLDEGIPYDPYVVIVPDTIAISLIAKVDPRGVRGWVLAHCEKDSVFTAYVITQRRAAVRAVPKILDDIKEGRLKNGDLIAVDGVNGKVYVQPDAETIARFEALRGTGQPEITKEHIPRLAREAMQTANINDLAPLPPKPDIPDMLKEKTWGGEKFKDSLAHLPPDMPTPAEILREVNLGYQAAQDAHKLAVLKVWQTIAHVQTDLLRDRRLDAEEYAIQEKAVADEIARLEALKPPPPPRPTEKTRNEKYGLTPLREGERDPNEPPEEEEQKRTGRRKLDAEAAPKALPAPQAAVATETAVATAELDAPKSAAESRREQREAELAAARAARSGEGEKK